MFIILNIVALFTTALFFEFRNLRESRADPSGVPGIEFLAGLFALIFWICLAVGCINIVDPYTYVESGVLYTQEIEIAGTWPFAFIYVGLTIVLFPLVIVLIPESWKAQFSRRGKL
jgi:hypothetical protein